MTCCSSRCGPARGVSGKLSDLAWLIFAVPLLAFLLSLVARQHHRAQRLSFAAAYVGLPLLYAAFNALDPLHDAIMRGIGALAGGVGSSPRDATDSLVIPLAWSIALWVWRRGPVGSSALRLRWALLLAGAASLASVATSAPSPDHGIRSVGAAEDSGVYALRYQGHHPEAISGLRPTYHSADGGLTWRGVPEGVDRVPWGTRSVETPRGRYALDGPHLVRIAGGQRQVVYAADYLGKAGNVWVQKHATSHLNERELTSDPQALAYDPRTGNVIVALGLLGVLVETADGELTHVAAGRYAPVDFSLVGKTRLLVSNAPFWAAALAVALSWTSMGLVIAQRRKGDLVARLPIAIAAVIAPGAARHTAALPYLLPHRGDGLVGPFGPAGVAVRPDRGGDLLRPAPPALQVGRHRLARTRAGARARIERAALHVRRVERRSLQP